jgi:hypothetical protein
MASPLIRKGPVFILPPAAIWGRVSRTVINAVASPLSDTGLASLGGGTCVTVPSETCAPIVRVWLSKPPLTGGVEPAGRPSVCPAPCCSRPGERRRLNGLRRSAARVCLCPTNPGEALDWIDRYLFAALGMGPVPTAQFSKESFRGANSFSL